MSENYLDEAKDLIRKHPYLMLSKSWCPDCHYAYSIWDRYGVSNTIHVIEFDKMSDQERAQKLEDAFFSLAPRRWVPTIFFNGSVWGTEQNLKDLDHEGKLEEALKKEGLIKLVLT